VADIERREEMTHTLTKDYRAAVAVAVVAHVLVRLGAAWLIFTIAQWASWPEWATIAVILLAMSIVEGERK
jgi:uncharacterized protein (DUF983 family)